MSFRQWLVGGVTVGLLASALFAKPGIVTNRQGETFAGDVTEDDANVYVNGAGGQLTFKKANIAKVQYTATVDDEYDQQHTRLKDNDVLGRIALANWANVHQRSDLAVKALQEARQIDPTNKEAARALDAAERQQELDHQPPPPKTPPGDVPPPPPPGGTPPPPPSASTKPVQGRRLLTTEEVNIIRQKEMTSDDPRVKIKFENGVVKKYLASGDHDAKAFAAMSPVEQALEILANGDKVLAKDVKVMTDPTALMEFKTKIYPILSNGCVSCHSGNKPGNFLLFSGDSVNTVYTNFYILQSYAATVDGVKYLALDRDAPEHSLVLQYGLPAKVGVPPHPAVSGWRPRFRSVDDAAYLTITDWLKNSLKVVKPNYGLDVGVTASDDAKK